MDYLPIFADLKRRPCLVVGGNDIAWRKAKMLLKAGADVQVISLHCHRFSSRLLKTAK